ncbi:MAG: Nif11 family protein, partial [Synechococcaceae bacterium WBB_34_004]|nr:Nif11 family protein [Synechococcaceae bacterium WBB_34_004]
MADQTVAQFVAKLGENEALRERLESANLAELLAIAKEHDLK